MKSSIKEKKSNNKGKEMNLGDYFNKLQGNNVN